VFYGVTPVFPRAGVLCGLHRFAPAFKHDRPHLDREITVKARPPDGVERSFQATMRIDTPQDVLYYEHGGILQYVLRQLLK